MVEETAVEERAAGLCLGEAGSSGLEREEPLAVGCGAAIEPWWTRKCACFNAARSIDSHMTRCRPRSCPRLGLLRLGCQATSVPGLLSSVKVV